MDSVKTVTSRSLAYGTMALYAVAATVMGAIAWHTSKRSIPITRPTAPHIEIPAADPPKPVTPVAPASTVAPEKPAEKAKAKHLKTKYKTPRGGGAKAVAQDYKRRTAQ